MHARPGKENFGKIRKGILLSLLESRVIRICLKRELADFLWNLLESSRRSTEVESSFKMSSPGRMDSLLRIGCSPQIRRIPSALQRYTVINEPQPSLVG